MTADSGFFRDRTVLVTGGTGFVGGHFVEDLLTRGARVRATRRRRPPSFDDPRIQWIEADLNRREECLRACQGADMVIHAAGSVGAAGVGPQDALLGMGDILALTNAVLWAAWGAKVPRVLVFGSSTGYPAADHPVREEEFWDGPVHPSYDGYGWARRYVERLAEFTARRSGMHVAVVRPGAIYGRHDNFDPATGHVMAGLIRRAEARETPYVVWGSGGEERDFLHVRDFVRGSLLVLEKGGSCDPVNIASGESVSIAALARLVLKVCGHDVEPAFDPTRPTAIPKRLIAIDKARALGFAPTIALEDGLTDTIRWLREARP